MRRERRNISKIGLDIYSLISPLTNSSILGWCGSISSQYPSQGFPAYSSLDLSGLLINNYAGWFESSPVRPPEARDFLLQTITTNDGVNRLVEGGRGGQYRALSLVQLHHIMRCSNCQEFIITDKIYICRFLPVICSLVQFSAVLKYL